MINWIKKLYYSLKKNYKYKQKMKKLRKKDPFIYK
jgi:hypothetical protein